jgi:hypothetical protein
MLTYRCYFYNRAGFLLKIEVATYPSDAHAVAWVNLLARQFPQYSTVELRVDSRLLHRIGDARDSAAD